MWFRIGNLPLRRKLLGAFGIVVALTLLVSVFGVYAIRANEHAQERVLHTQDVITDLNQLEISLYVLRSSYSSYLLTGQEEQLIPFRQQRERYPELINHLREQTADNPGQQERLDDIDGAVSSLLRDTMDPVLERAASGQAIDTVREIQVVRDEVNRILRLVEEAVGEEQSLLAERSARAQELNTRLERLLVAGTGGAVLAGAVLAWLISGDIAGRVMRLADVARQVAGGSYGQRLRFRRQDEIGQAATAFDRMAESLESTIQQLESAKRRAEADRQRTAAVLNSVADGILTFLPNGTVTESNPAAERMFGLPEEAFRGKPIDELLRCDPAIGDLPSVLDLILPADGANQDSMHTVLGCRSDGTSFPLEIAVSRMEETEPAQYIGVVRDISERREAERRLREQMEQAHRTRSIANAVLDAAGEGMILISPDTVITALNRRFAELFDVQITEVINRPMREFGADLDKRIGEADQFRQMLYASVGDSERRIEQAFTQIWPQRRELDMVSTPVRTRDGRHIGRVYAFRDVTHEREVDRMKSEFVSMVSHELRTPLTSIKGYVDLLLEGEVGELTPDQREFLEIVGSNAERLVALINDILDISRIEAGRITLNSAPVDMAALLERLSVSFRPQVEGKRQSLTLDIPADLPPVQGDAERLTQIFANLISNAHKYTPAGGRVTVSAEAHGDRVRVRVSDTGIGLSPDEQEKLFTRFYRAQNRATQEVGGTGLGLAITRSLVELHGGTIEVESAPGVGSTFTVLLPQAPARPAAAGEATGDEHADGRILIVEDEPDIAQLLRRYLERAGYAVRIAADAATALHMAREMAFDLVTLDVILPDADGFTVLEWLKSDPKTAAIPVIMLSMVPDEGQGRSLGAVDYLVKPIREDALLQRISRLLAIAQSGTVLVADDEPDIRRLMAQHLSRAGYQVLEARDGEEAVRLATTEQVDAVFLDIRMPGMDGITALQAIRRQRSPAELPIIMMTASPGMLDAADALRGPLGISDLLEKPITGEELAESIARTLKRRNEVPR